jgi:hypothetical protein
MSDSAQDAKQPSDARSEFVTGGRGRRDEVGRSGVYPADFTDAPADAVMREEGGLGRHPDALPPFQKRLGRKADLNLVLSPPLLGFVVGTRAALGFGLGLLLSDRIPEPRRRNLGMVLVAIGAVTTIPAAISVFGRRRRGPFAPADARAAS